MPGSNAEKEIAAQQAIDQYHPIFLSDPNVVGMAIGNKTVGLARGDEPCVVFFVIRKIPPARLGPSALLPASFSLFGETVVTDVVETGPFYPQPNTSRERPARPGVSIGEVRSGSGTFGAIVVDQKSRTRMILSNNHVLARSNAAAVGATIIQPGSGGGDGGTSPADDIARLARFSRIDPTTRNTLDAAIAEPLSDADLGLPPHDGIPAPSPTTPAVGLLFAGGPARTVYHPIDPVLAELEVTFPEEGSTKAPEKDMNVQKTGRTTDGTDGTILEIGGVVKVGFPGIGMVTVGNVFLTTVMSSSGDSGSVAVLGGAGGVVPSALPPDEVFELQDLPILAGGKVVVELVRLLGEKIATVVASEAGLPDEARATLDGLKERYRELLETRLLRRGASAGLTLEQRHLTDLSFVLELVQGQLDDEERAVIDRARGVLEELVGRPVNRIVNDLLATPDFALRLVPEEVEAPRFARLRKALLD